MKDTIIKLVLAVSALALGILLVRFAVHKPPPRKINRGLEPGDVMVSFGCTRDIEQSFKDVKGVHVVSPGFMSPENQDCSSKDVFEVITVFFNKDEISYQELLDLYIRNSNATEKGGVIFYENDWMKKVAEDSKAALNASGEFDKEIVTEILPHSKSCNELSDELDPEVLQTRRCKEHYSW